MKLTGEVFFNRVDAMKRNLIAVFFITIALAAAAPAQQPEAPPQTQSSQPRVPPRIVPKPTFAETIRRHLQRSGATVDETKSTADMVVSNHSDLKGNRTTIVIVNDRRKSLLGFYIYNFGSLKSASNREEVYKYLLAANDAITIGSFFVDSDEDIGYKYLVASGPALSASAFDTVYLTMAAVARERRPEIRQLLGLSTKKEENPSEVKKAAEDKPPVN
jgi:hypothetical protein